MDHAESLMEEHPDSALNLLTRIHGSSIGNRKEKARLALLLSMALDKNYIDTTTFDVLQPAIDYYPTHGNRDEKLRTYYYQGVIYQNSGERDKALDSFVKALDVSHGCKDSLTLARTMVAQSLLYKDFYDFNGYVAASLKAADIYRQGNIRKLEFECLLNALNGTIILGDKSKADSLFSVLNIFPDLGNKESDILQEYRLSYALKFGTVDELKKIIQECVPYIKPGGNSIMNLAYACSKTGDNETARQLLDALDSSRVGYDTTKYQYIYVSVLRDLGDYKDAFQTYWGLSKRLDSINVAKFDQKARSLEEKHQIEFRAQKDSRRQSMIIWGCAGGIILLFMGVVILILLVRSSKAKRELALEGLRLREMENMRLKAEKENLAHQVMDLERESDSLRSIIDTEADIPVEVQNAIKVRIEMLNALLAAYIADNNRYESAYYEKVKKVTENTNDFMNSNRMAFQVSHPHFIQYFEEHGLTVDEINYVCLYAIGLKGKEVGNYIKKPGHVNTSSAIRKKLGIDKHDTNLGIYVRKLLQSL